MALSPDNKHLVTASAHDENVRIFALDDAANQKPLAELTGHQNGVTQVAFSPDGSLLATATSASRFVRDVAQSECATVGHAIVDSAWRPGRR